MPPFVEVRVGPLVPVHIPPYKPEGPHALPQPPPSDLLAMDTQERRFRLHAPPSTETYSPQSPFGEDSSTLSCSLFFIDTPGSLLLLGGGAPYGPPPPLPGRGSPLPGSPATLPPPSDGHGDRNETRTLGPEGR